MKKKLTILALLVLLAFTSCAISPEFITGDEVYVYWGPSHVLAADETMGGYTIDAGSSWARVYEMNEEGDMLRYIALTEILGATIDGKTVDLSQKGAFQKVFDTVSDNTIERGKFVMTTPGKAGTFTFEDHSTLDFSFTDENSNNLKVDGEIYICCQK